MGGGETGEGAAELPVALFELLFGFLIKEEERDSVKDEGSREAWSLLRR